MNIEYLLMINNTQQNVNLIVGDITDQKTDAIVNAANENLILGAGVAGAIRRKGGPSIQEACNRLQKVPTGDAQITTAGNLEAKYIIHAVGPVFKNYTQAEATQLLFMAVKNSLFKMKEHELTSISFPALSTGIYGFPKKKAAETMLRSILDFLGAISTPLLIQICLYSENDFHIFQDVAHTFFKDQLLI